MKNNIMKNKTTQLVSAFLGICAVLAAVIMIAVPVQTNASDDWGDYGNDYGGYSYDSGYDWGDYGNDYSGYSYDSGYDWGDYGNDYSGYSYDSGYDYGSYDYGGYDYGDYDTYCSDCGGSYDYSYPTYSSYVPSYSSYSTPRYVSGGGSGYSTPSYVYNTNTAVSNANAQANSASNSNASIGDIVNNNVNNNTVVVNTPSTSNNPTTPTVPALDGYCVISPSLVYINQDVTLSATAIGGTGSYTYSWSGTDGISGNSQTFTGRFGSTGSKSATVTITSGSRSITRSCNVTVQGQQINNINAYCVATPSVANVGQTVTWTAYVNGGTSGNYSYTWNGSDGLYGNGQSVFMNYNSVGVKTANVTVYANGQTVTASCNMTVQGQTAGVTVIRTPDQGTPVSGIYLSQIPATGIKFNLKTILFTLGLAIWSAFMAYVMINRRKSALAGISSSTSPISFASKAEAFKMKNMQKRGISA